FIDGDDWVDIDQYQAILDSAEQNQADIVFFGYVREDLEIGVARNVGLESVVGLDPAVLNSQLIAEMVGPSYLPSPFKGQEMLGAAPRRLFRQAFLLENQLRFPDEPLLEDSPFALQSHMAAKNVSFNSVKPYHYRMNSESMTWKRRSGLFNQYKRLFQLIKDIISGATITYSDDADAQRYVSYEALQRRLNAWFIRFAAHSALINSMQANYTTSSTNRMAAVRIILDDPLVRQCVKESDLEDGSISDRLILFLIKHRIMPLTVCFYHWYARRLSSSSNLKR
ncbi:MAG: hypothetical protein GX562_05620, partial [Coriobacteriaceae bacterium]|nr:hypothetical protein [Coriobacteriaceae bacterium]